MFFHDPKQTFVVRRFRLAGLDREAQQPPSIKAGGASTAVDVDRVSRALDLIACAVTAASERQCSGPHEHRSTQKAKMQPGRASGKHRQDLSLHDVHVKHAFGGVDSVIEKDAAAIESAVDSVCSGSSSPRPKVASKASQSDTRHDRSHTYEPYAGPMQSRRAARVPLSRLPDKPWGT